MRNKKNSGEPPNISREQWLSDGQALFLFWGLMLLWIVVVSWVSFGLAVGKQGVLSVQKMNHPCCLCPCGIQDYPHDCMKLCVLPKDEIGDERMMEELEQTMCAHLCAFKHEGKKHNEH